MTSQWLTGVVVIMLYALSWTLVLKVTNWRARLLNQPKPKPYTGINLAYRSIEEWGRLYEATPDHGTCYRCCTYGPYDDGSYRVYRLCFWCAELERERERVES